MNDNTVYTRLLIPALLMILVPSTALGQRYEGSIKVGVASTTFEGDLAAGATTWSRRTGFAAGGSMGVKLRYGFTPALELTYVRMGASTRVIFLNVPATMQSNLTYLTATALLQYRLYSGGYVNPRVFAGPALSYTAAATITVRARDGLGALSEQDDSIEGSDFGFTAGGGIDMEIGSQILTLEMRYYIGQRDVTKPNPELGESDVRNRGVVVMAGILF